MVKKKPVIDPLDINGTFEITEIKKRLINKGQNVFPNGATHENHNIEIDKPVFTFSGTIKDNYLGIFQSFNGLDLSKYKNSHEFLNRLTYVGMARDEMRLLDHTIFEDKKKGDDILKANETRGQGRLNVGKNSKMSTSGMIPYKIKWGDFVMNDIPKFYQKNKQMVYEDSKGNIISQEEYFGLFKSKKDGIYRPRIVPYDKASILRISDLHTHNMTENRKPVFKEINQFKEMNNNSKRAGLDESADFLHYYDIYAFINILMVLIEVGEIAVIEKVENDDKGKVANKVGLNNLIEKLLYSKDKKLTETIMKKFGVKSTASKELINDMKYTNAFGKEEESVEFIREFETYEHNISDLFQVVLTNTNNSNKRNVFARSLSTVEGNDEKEQVIDVKLL